jgi:SnoaL-like protein
MTNIAEAVARLVAESDIGKLIHTYPRGLDRLDRDILLSIGRTTATVEFTGMFNGTWPEFVDWLMKAHTTMLYNRHTIGNVLIEVRGDIAVSETTATANLIVSRPDGDVEERITHSRYLDSWGHEDGRWWLTRRHTLRDRRTVKVMTQAEFAATTEYVHAADIGRTDPSYAHLAG